ncbi:MAG: HD domain-containing protein [Roseburia sp.]|nr:HD domain-containing protein [Roseburia sp.]
MDVYEKCPILENDRYVIRLIEERDAEDLLEVYGDKKALPFFNSDNCHGSNFYCACREDMDNTIKYWLIEYHENKGFVRFSIVDKDRDKVIGTIEMFKRTAADSYNDCGILRPDVGSTCERETLLCDILTLVTAPFHDWFACGRIATKAPVYAVDRIAALRKAGYVKSEEPLIGWEGIAYYDYWIHARKIPDREEAERLLEEAERCNPGKWGNHSRYTAQCAQRIAARCDGMDADKAYVLGLLHDIGRKFGVKHLGHIYDGYHYMLELGYDEAARICLTHSFCIQNIHDYIGRFDIPQEQQEELADALRQIVYDDYDRLIQLCDSFAGAEGIMRIEERMADVKRRYGSYPQEKWDKNISLKRFFEEKAGGNIDDIVRNG